MKLSFFIPDFSGGGAEYMIINMANEFARQKHHVDLVVVRNIGPHKKRVASNVNIVSFDRDRIITSIPSLRRYLSAEQPDIFLSAMTYVNVISILAKLSVPRLKTRFILTERTVLSSHIKKFRWLRQKLIIFLVKLLYPFANKVVGISKGTAKDIQKLADLEESKVTWIYNPVLTSAILAEAHVDKKRGGSKKHSPQKDLHLNARAETLILTCGRLENEKDHATLLRSFAQLVTQYHQKSFRLFILGTGSLRQNLEDQAQSLGIENQVTFLGFVDDPLHYMKQADLFVLSSLHEGFGNVLVEALYCGLPIVSTDCPSGPREILADGKYGALVPVGDTESLAKAMDKMLNTSHTPEKQKERAMDFTVEKICDQYERLFKNLF